MIGKIGNSTISDARFLIIALGDQSFMFKADGAISFVRVAPSWINWE